MKANRLANQFALRVSAFNRDYFDERGEKPNHFVCPITLRDEPAELIKGHVFSQTLPGCSGKWVPQRKDVDNVFSAVESDFQAAIRAKSNSIDEIMSDKKLYKQIRPKFELNGSPVNAGFHKSGRGKKHSADFIAHLPASEIGDKLFVTIDSIVERDDCAAAFVCALQSAHLTMFELLGYSYVYSYPGNFLAGVLNSYVQQAASDRASRVLLAETFRTEYLNMVIPLEEFTSTPPFEGTLEDKKLLTVVGQDGVQHATGIVVRFASEFLIVLLPSEKSKQGKYFKLLMEPMDSITFHVTQIETRDRRITQVFPTSQFMKIQIR